MRKLDQVPIGIAHHNEISDDTADISWFFHQNVLCSRQRSNAVNILARFTLKSKMIEARLHFILDDDEREDWIFAFLCLRSQPNIMSPF